MGLGRNFFLWASRNQKLRGLLPRYHFVRKSVKRFMPGEQISDALEAAEELRQRGIPTIATHLGENVTEQNETTNVTRHYLELLEEIKKRELETHISIKLTELGLDLNPDLCFANLKTVIEKAGVLKNFVWIDMEGSNYTSRTIELFKRARSQYLNVGLCLQAYLYRTAEDLEKLLPLSPAIRLVKGAYAEPPSIAFEKKKDTDENYFKLARRLLSQTDAKNGSIGIATHDQNLIARIQKEAKAAGISKDRFEIQMLYGIRSDVQRKLVQENSPVRVLISYGIFWFPWYMRRLAERPANVFFVIRNLFLR